MKVKKGSFLAFIISMLIITGCGKTDALQTEKGLVETKLVKTELGIGKQIDYSEHFLKGSGDTIFYIDQEDTQGEWGFNYILYEENIENPGIVKEKFTLTDRYVLNYCVRNIGEEQQICILSALQDNYLLESYTQEGRIENSISLPKNKLESYLFLDMIQIDQGKYLLIQDKNLLEISEDETLKNIEYQFSPKRILQTKSGDIYLVYCDENDIEYMARLKEDYSVQEVISLEGNFLGNIDDFIYTVKQDGIYALDITDNNVEQVMKFSYYNISAQRVKGIWGDFENPTFLLYYEAGNKLYIGSVVEKTAEELALQKELDEKIRENPDKYTQTGRRIITIFCPYGEGSGSLINSITLEEFNELSDSFYAVIVEGDEEELQKKLLQEEGYDILIELQSSRLQKYERNNYLEDLNNFLPQVSSFEELSPDVVRAYETNGKLFSIPSVMQVSSMLVPESKSQGMTSWNTEEFINWVASYKELSINKLDVLNYCLVGNLDSYVDFENSKVFFREDNFARMLENINNLSHPSGEWTGLYNSIENEGDLFILGSISSVANIRLNEEKIGESLVIMGFPNDKGERKALPAFGLTFSILSNSSCKEGAADFIWNYISRYDEPELSQSGVKNTLNSGMAYSIKRLWEKSKKNVTGEYEIYDGEEEYLYKFIVTNKDIDRFYDAISITKKETEIEIELREIVEEEALLYFKGERNLEETCKIIQNRAEIIISEKQ